MFLLCSPGLVKSQKIALVNNELRLRFSLGHSSTTFQEAAEEVIFFLLVRRSIFGVAVVDETQQLQQSLAVLAGAPEQRLQVPSVFVEIEANS